MRGNPEKQICSLWSLSGIDQIGQSKHEAKATARAFGAKSTPEMAKNTGVFGYQTKDNYLPRWTAILEHAKENAGVKDVCRLQPEHIAAYLRDYAETGPKWSGFTAVASAAQKLEVALNAWSLQHGKEQRYDFGGTIKEVRNDYRGILDRSADSRRYEDPRAVIAAIQKPEHALVAALQLDAKTRISETTLIKPQQLLGVKVDPLTGTEKGFLAVEDGKGGKAAAVPADLGTYRALEAYIAEHGQLHITDKDAYRQDVKAAAEATGQSYNGSHGFRWSGACDRLEELRDAGVSYPAALQAVSHEMLHERLSITLHYTRDITPW